MSAPALFAFTAGAQDGWKIDRVVPVRGESLPAAPRLSMVRNDAHRSGTVAAWTLRGVTSNLRYTEERERQRLVRRQDGLGRNEANLAALIPIRKTSDWWQLAQDERRGIFEERSRHIAIGEDYLPAVARQLRHCRDLAEPFDFLTWFEYSESNAGAFEDLVGRLRETEEWRYVDREVDVRLVRDGNDS